MRILVLGDTHMDKAFVSKAFEMANQYGCPRIMQLGDFGVWPGKHGKQFLEHTSRLALETKVNFYFLPGNHEDYSMLDSLEAENADDFIEMLPGIFYAGKTKQWYWGKHKFAAVGGAASIDIERRIENVSWWPQEMISDSEFEIAKSFSEIDILFTHDASNSAPFRNYLKTDINSRINRSKIDSIVDALRPSLMLHGHMHNYYDYQRNNTQIYGLECNDAAMPYYVPNWDSSKAHNMCVLALGERAWNLTWVR